MFSKDEDGTEALDLANLRQMKLVLQEKMETIGKLDNAIFDNLHDDEAMEQDVEEADKFNLKI